MFVVVEGLDGSGKNSLVDKLDEHFQLEETKVYVTQEPTSWTDSGRRLRSMMSQGDGYLEDLGAEQWASLFINDRRQHCAKIGEFLSKGNLVLCVRYDLSTYAYQGFQRFEHDYDPSWVGVFRQLYREHLYNQWGGCLVPKLTIYLDLPVQIAMERIKKRLEKEANPDMASEMFETPKKLKAIKGYYNLAMNFLKHEDNRTIERVDATPDLDSLTAICLPIIRSAMNSQS